MIHLNNFIRKTIPVSTIPLLVSILAFIIKNVIAGILIIHDSIMPQDRWQGFGDQSLNLLHQVIERSMNTYGSYTSFIITIMILHTGLDSISSTMTSLKMTLKSRSTLNIDSRNPPSAIGPENATKLGCQMSLLDKLKELGLYISTTFLQYTLCYCLYVLILSCVGYILYSYTLGHYNAEALALKDKNHGNQGKSLLQGEVEQLSVHMNMMFNEPFGKIERNSKRRLDLQTLGPDVVNVLTLLYIDTGVGLHQNFIVFNSDENITYLFNTYGLVKSINMSDINSPTIITSNWYINAFTQYYLFFPNGRTILYHNKNGLCIANIALDPNTEIIYMDVNNQTILKPQSNNLFDYPLENTLFALSLTVRVGF